MDNKIEIDISKLGASFEQFLTLVGNERIIVSGIFGSGKTYFLRKFFRENAEKYIAFHLYPTNYSVSKNEDIFELIKYDLFYQIILHKPYLEKIEPSFINTLPFLKFTDSLKVVEPFIEFIPKIGQYISRAWPAITRLIEVVDKKKGEITTNEGERLGDYVNHFHQAKGNIYEMDIYTELINNLILKIKGQGQQVVLILDDLDRIDPEHIFRILNVFAVHFNVLDLPESENKFGVDKIVLCCDIDNIRAIFKSKYGQNVDFNGYIDKFYTRDIFVFNNTTIIISAIEKILLSVGITGQFPVKVQWLPGKGMYYTFFKYILGSMTLSNVLNLRTILKLYGLEYRPAAYPIYFENNAIQNWQVPLITIFDFLSWLFGGLEATSSAIDKMTLASSQQQVFRMGGAFGRVYLDMHMIISHRKHNFKLSGHTYETPPPVASYVIREEPSVTEPQLYAINPDGKPLLDSASISLADFKQTLVAAFATYSTFSSTSVRS